MSITERIRQVFDVFSRRHPEGLSDDRDILEDTTRTRILLLYRDTVTQSIGSTDPDAGLLWEEVHNSLQYLHGRTVLSQRMRNRGLLTPGAIIEDMQYFLQECSTEDFLDFIELSFKGRYAPRSLGDSKPVIDAINEILRVDQAPYYLTDLVRVWEETTASLAPGIPAARGVKVERIIAFPMIVKVEEDVVYREAVEPALTILGVDRYGAANSEFRNALEHYRNGKFRESLTDCASALESVLKVICSEKGWPYQQADTLGELLDNAVPRLGLEPVFKENFKILASIRNRFSSSHGGGTSAREPERSLAQYMITTTAATIVLIVASAESKRRSR